MKLNFLFSKTFSIISLLFATIFVFSNNFIAASEGTGMVAIYWLIEFFGFDILFILVALVAISFLSDSFKNIYYNFENYISNHNSFGLFSHLRVLFCCFVIVIPLYFLAKDTYYFAVGKTIRYKNLDLSIIQFAYDSIDAGRFIVAKRHLEFCAISLGSSRCNVMLDQVNYRVDTHKKIFDIYQIVPDFSPIKETLLSDLVKFSLDDRFGVTESARVSKSRAEVSSIYLNAVTSAYNGNIADALDKFELVNQLIPGFGDANLFIAELEGSAPNTVFLDALKEYGPDSFVSFVLD